MKQIKNSLRSATLGAVAIGSLIGATSAFAGESPFATQALDAGYAQLAAATPEGKCGEGKCGEGKGDEGKCGEGKCGGAEGGAGGGKDGEGKCGEGRCGGAE